MCLSGFGGVGLKRACQVPGKQFLDSADRMISDLRQHGAEVEFRIQSVELRRSDQGIHRGGAFAATVGTCEQEVFAPKSDGAQRPLGGAVVDLE